MSNGKGDSPRPSSVDAATYRERYAEAFGNTESEYTRNRALRAACAERGHPWERFTMLPNKTTAACECGQRVQSRPWEW